MSKERKIATCLELAQGCASDARLLIGAASRNAAYLASQAAEHVVTAIATSEDLHIERKDAHQLDTIIRRIPTQHPDHAALSSISFLEAYSTSYRYGTPTGRVPISPPTDRVAAALDEIERLIAELRRHFDVEASGGIARNVAPRR
ncbi:hypothetical protein ABS772_04645 [Methylorubrum podarium]|uniref:HEPN domain-containing protein n=1 Tax=Methylorubrum podarium TaxID=200476 RepID=A0ABV1QII4_9HYPH